jgi:predicted dehydrogenase
LGARTAKAEFMRGRKKIGFAVVGLGAIARGAVLPAFAHAKNAKLVAVVSRDRLEAAAVARKFRAPAYYTADEFSKCLANPEVSAVYIATPPGAHASYAMQAAAAGKHVLSEKPLAANVEQAAQMVEACRRGGVLLMTAYRKYFEPSCVYLKKLIQNGDLGRVDVIHTAFSELYTPRASLAWLVDPKLAGGGPLMDLGIYCVNTTRWLVKEDPIEVTAQTWTSDAAKFRDVEESVSFRLRFPSGLIVQGSSSYGAVLCSFVFVQGSKGWASLAPAFDFSEERRLTVKIGKKRWIERKFAVRDEFAPELDALAEAIRTNRPVEGDGVQGLRDMIILEAIYKSARNGRSLAIDYSLAGGVGN